ncbi:hypothetical protein [Thomasclavelia cocleata]|uniref:hypothetical protein n=1 Tax=Thomasclavelia cocleata TaxID=69824 RepID=UPI002432A716|nr:hypothetical protein [Thomasclavelia cocleata]
MYSIIKDVLNKGNYELVDILNKINKLWVENALAEEQRDELVNLARTNANPENSYIENTQQIANLWEYYQQLDSRVTALENSSGTIEPIEPEEEWPEYVQPTGAHNAYKIGNRVMFQGKKYICQVDGCVWDPLTYPSAWELVETTE